MSDPRTDSPAAQDKPFLRRVHEQPKRYLREWIGVPAHLHHVAHRMANPPMERPQTRKEFLQLLDCLGIGRENAEVGELFGFGLRTEPNGDRLVLVWDAHTEYYSYQAWHIPKDPAAKLEFGPLAIPGYVFPICPLGLRVNALDILVHQEATLSQDVQVVPEGRVAPDARPWPDGKLWLDALRARIPGPQLYGSRVFGEDLSVITSFTPDADLRERYLIVSPSGETLRQNLSRIVDTVVWIENYYHLILLPFRAFSRAVDQVHQFEQRHLYQRAVITEQLEGSTSHKLQKWLAVLTQDFLQVSRMAESMRYRLSAAVPYDSIVRGNLQALQEAPLPPLRPLSDYLRGGITGVADGYQQLIRRIDALEGDFEATIRIIRTRVELALQEQNLALQDQNIHLLASVDNTTRSQALLQRTVESLSVIVITYYLTGLANHVFKALHELGWLPNATYATALFVPMAVGLSVGLMVIGRKIIHKRMGALPKE